MEVVHLGTHVRRFFSADDFSRRSNLNILDEYDVTRVADYDVVIHLAAFLEKDPTAAEQCFRFKRPGHGRFDPADGTGIGFPLRFD